MARQNKDECEFDYGSHKQGRVPENITILSDRTRRIKIPKPTMFDGMGEIDND